MSKVDLGIIISHLFDLHEDLIVYSEENHCDEALRCAFELEYMGERLNKVFEKEEVKK